MRGTVAKRIRKAARLIAAKNPTQYKMNWIQKFTGRRNSEGKRVADYRGVLVCTGYRRVYQDMKAQYRGSAH